MRPPPGGAGVAGGGSSPPTLHPPLTVFNNPRNTVKQNGKL